MTMIECNTVQHVDTYSSVSGPGTMHKYTFVFMMYLDTT